MICSALVIINAVKIVLVSSSEKEEEADISDTIIQALETEDVELMESIFANNIREDGFLESQIKDMYEFIDGNIISYINRGSNNGGGYLAGDKSEIYNSGTITDITTDKGEIYNLYFSGCTMYGQDDENEGLMYIKIVSEDQITDDNFEELISKAQTTEERRAIMDDLNNSDKFIREVGILEY